MAKPPPLPPRNLSTEPSAPRLSAESTSSNDWTHLMPTQGTGGLPGASLSLDPRTSSTQSLGNPAPDAGTTRTLLIIYIHGFYGNNQSFRSFPAHVHTYLSQLLAETHTIHSKIYPRYKTYKAIEVARDKFSAWLEPHESPTTDVILVGHSMGGLLAAEVALMPNHNPYRQQPFKHRILGTLSLDSPFLGLHPGIVVTGISSLFQPAAKPDADSMLSASQTSINTDTQSLAPSLQYSETASSITSPPAGRPSDPFYDPPFFNDQPFREQPFVKRVMNFASKHRSEGLFNAMGNHILSHIEFGGCLADYRGMTTRYNKIRALEDVDEVKAKAQGHPPGAFARVRFVNYYTLSPGKPKPPKVDAEEPQPSDITSEKVEIIEPSEPIDTKPDGTDKTGAEIPIIKTETVVERADGNESDYHSAGEYLDEKDASLDMARLSMQDLDPTPLEEIDHQHETNAAKDAADLPPIPEVPVPPTLPNLELFTDKDDRKQAEKESKRLQKAHAQAVKDREKAIRERDKLIEKRRRKSEKESQRMDKEALKEKQKAEKEERKKLEREAAQAIKDQEAETAVSPSGEKPKKLRKFCSLPSKVGGQRDATWVDVYMDGMDEVTAHCALFMPGEHYDSLVGDVGERVLNWVQEDMSKKTALGLTC